MLLNKMSGSRNGWKSITTRTILQLNKTIKHQLVVLEMLLERISTNQPIDNKKKKTSQFGQTLKIIRIDGRSLVLSIKALSRINSLKIQETSQVSMIYMNFLLNKKKIMVAGRVKLKIE